MEILFWLFLYLPEPEIQLLPPEWGRGGGGGGGGGLTGSPRWQEREEIEKIKRREPL